MGVSISSYIYGRVSVSISLYVYGRVDRSIPLYMYGMEGGSIPLYLYGGWIGNKVLIIPPIHTLVVILNKITGTERTQAIYTPTRCLHTCDYKSFKRKTQ